MKFLWLWPINLNWTPNPWSCTKNYKTKINKSIYDLSFQNWFKPFNGGDLSLEIKSRCWQHLVVDYDTLKYKVEEDPSTKNWKFSEVLESLKDAICRALYKFKKHTRKTD